MSRWLIKLGQQLQPLYERMYKFLLKQLALWSDDTPVKVLDVDKTQCTMWVCGCGGDKPTPIGKTHRY